MSAKGGNSFASKTSLKDFSPSQFKLSVSVQIYIEVMASQKGVSQAVDTLDICSIVFAQQILM